MLKKKLRLSALSALLVSFSAFSAFNYAPIIYSKNQLEQSFKACLDVFPQKDTTSIEKTFQNKINNIDMRPTPLCSDEFAVLYSKTSKTPLVVVERLNRQSISKAKTIKRTNSFFPDPRLKKSDRANIEDYKSSGFDRGHNFPAADASTHRSMMQSFSLSNVFPQDSFNNRELWSKIEKDTRKYAYRAEGDIYVYTGPLFLSKDIETIGKSRVWIPTHLYKVVYDESKRKAWAFILENSASAKVGRPITYQEFKRITGFDLIPME